MFEVTERLEKCNITVNKMAEAAVSLIPPLDEESVSKQEVTRRIMHYLGDPNVSSLLIAAILLEDELIHNRENSEIADDPVYLLSDEIIGISIAQIISGPQGKFAFTKYDQQKPGILSELGPFLDDAVAGLIAGCMVQSAVIPKT